MNREKDKIDLNWAGYNQAQKTQIQELIQEAKRQKIESVPVQPDPSSKRKSNVSGQMPSSKRYFDSDFKGSSDPSHFFLNQCR